MELVGKLHGMPRSLVSDHDPMFNHFWKDLFRMSETKLRMSSAYHPQSNAQTKVVNRVVEQYLWAFIHKQPSMWGRFLPWAKWSYNTSHHSSMELSPSEITFSKKPPNLPQYIIGASRVKAVDDFLVNHDALFESLHKKLLWSTLRINIKEILSSMWVTWSWSSCVLTGNLQWRMNCFQSWLSHFMVHFKFYKGLVLWLTNYNYPKDPISTQYFIALFLDPFSHHLPLQNQL